MPGAVAPLAIFRSFVAPGVTLGASHRGGSPSLWAILQPQVFVWKKLKHYSYLTHNWGLSESYFMGTDSLKQTGQPGRPWMMTLCLKAMTTSSNTESTVHASWTHTSEQWNPRDRKNSLLWRRHGQSFLPVALRGRGEAVLGREHQTSHAYSVLFVIWAIPLFSSFYFCSALDIF